LTGLIILQLCIVSKINNDTNSKQSFQKEAR